MKKPFPFWDKASLFIIILNYASFLSVFWIFAQPNLEGAADILASIVMLYGVFGSVGGFFLGISSNILSLIQKRNRKTTLNLVCLILYLLMLPIWWKLLLQATVLSV